jgi:hypothetical protein
MGSRRFGAFSEYRWRRLPICRCAKDTLLVLAILPREAPTSALQGMPRPKRWHRSIAARRIGSAVAAAKSPGWFTWAVATMAEVATARHVH